MASTILNREMLEALPPTLGSIHGCLLSPLLFNMVRTLQPQPLSNKEEIRRIQIKNNKVKLSLFADSMILCMLELIREFPKTAEHKINTQKSTSYTQTQ